MLMLDPKPTVSRSRAQNALTRRILQRAVGNIPSWLEMPTVRLWGPERLAKITQRPALAAQMRQRSATPSPVSLRLGENPRQHPQRYHGVPAILGAMRRICR